LRAQLENVLETLHVEFAILGKSVRRIGNLAHNSAAISGVNFSRSANNAVAASLFFRRVASAAKTAARMISSVVLLLLDHNTTRAAAFRRPNAASISRRAFTAESLGS
jgi:hypothetical protein